MPKQYLCCCRVVTAGHLLAEVPAETPFWELNNESPGGLPGWGCRPDFYNVMLFLVSIYLLTPVVIFAGTVASGNSR
jgi:hypothetical protein